MHRAGVGGSLQDEDLNWRPCQSRGRCERRARSQIVPSMQPASAWSTSEYDRHHVEVLVEQFELAGEPPLATSSVDEVLNHEDKAEGDPSSPLSLEVTYKTISSRCDYIAVDRGDAQYALQEFCRDMASPKQASWLVCLGRYLFGRPRVVLTFLW